MQRFYVAALAACVASAAATAAAAAEPACAKGQPGSFADALVGGREYARAPALDALMGLRGAGTVDDVSKKGADCLQRYYAMRSGRQQVLLDGGAATVFIGGIGSLASKPAGATTQAYWSYVALTPVVISQFTANQPIRDLYTAGGIGLEVIEGRYRELERLEQNLGHFKARPTPNCDAVAKLNIEAWAPSDDKTAVLADYRAMRKGCAEVYTTDLAVDEVLAMVGGIKGRFPRDYANDLLRLDRQLLLKDRQLRYSPVQTLSAMAAAPFAAAATLLSGENGGQAIDRLKTQQTFSNLTVPLGPIVMPSVPAVTSQAYQVSEVALLRATTVLDEQAKAAAVAAAEAAKAAKAGKKAKAQPVAAPPTMPKLPAAVATLQQAAVELNQWQAASGKRIALAREIVTVASYNQLLFDYDAPTGRIRVVLAAVQPSTTTAAPLAVSAAQP